MEGMPPGYKQLSQDQLARLHRIAAIKEQLANELADMARENHDALPALLDAEGIVLCAQIDRANDALFEARRYLQTGFMWLTRSIANPEGF